MLVLDYPRNLRVEKPGNRNAITIPPFHTGHLGFVPESEVHIGLLAPFTDDGTHCEVLVTPYESGKFLGRINCTMLDQRGVVQKLVDAVSSLNVNILLLATSSVHHARYHQINILFDWGTSQYDPAEISSEKDQLRYQLYRTNFPIDLHCYVIMFEKIVQFCLEDLALVPVVGLPELSIRPVTTPNNLDANDRVMIERAPALKHKQKSKNKENIPGHVKVTLSPELEHVLRQRLGVNPDDPLEYLLISETEDRVLRAFFPRPDDMKNVVYVGIQHDDRPRALSQLLMLVRTAGFNVITGLLRQGDGQSRMWEGLLKYEGVQKLTIDRKSPEIYSWVADRLAHAALGTDAPAQKRLGKCDLQVGPPKYPKSGMPEKLIALSEAIANVKILRRKKRNALKAEDVYVRQQIRQCREEIYLKQDTVTLGADNEIPKKILRAVKERKNRLYKINRPDADRPHLLKLYDLVMGGQFSRLKPLIFLSYPVTAEAKANAVENKLKKHFKFERYQDGDLQIIVDEVIRRIESCDYFIGIWDIDRPPAGPSKGSRKKGGPTRQRMDWRLSTWLPFEYGIAKTARKRTIVAHHNELDKKVWNRISPEVAQPGYDDTKKAGFHEVALPVIVTHCMQEWIPSQSRRNRL